jgi:hypothetical protein
MSKFDWFQVLAGGASVAAVPLGLVLWWASNRTLAAIHAATQLTLTDLGKGQTEMARQFQASQERLGAMLAQMEANAVTRHEDRR